MGAAKRRYYMFKNLIGCKFLVYHRVHTKLKFLISYVKRMPYFKNQSGEFDLSVFKAAFNNSPRKENEYLTSVKNQVIYLSMVRKYVLYIKFYRKKRLTFNEI